MKKIFSFLKKIIFHIKQSKNFLSAKIVFKNPEKKDIVIFNSWQFYMYKSLFETKNYFCLEVPHRKVNKIYISFLILKLILIEILNRNFKLSYYLALIKITKPKLVITWIDNDSKFYKLAKILEKKIKFCAIQGAYRDMYDLDKTQASKIYIPNYFCFGEQTKEHFKKIGAKVNKFYIVGSYRQSMAEKYLKKNNLINGQYKYDICLISENIPAISYKFSKIRFDSLELIAKYVERLAIKHKLKTILALKSPKDHVLYEEEISFYKKILDKKTPIIIENRLNEFANYEKAYNSKLTIGSRSSILLETFARGGKILSCNYKKNYFSKYPELNPLLSFDSYFSISDKTYDKFEKRVLFLLSMSQEDFDMHSKNIKNYMLDFDKNFSAFDKINTQLNQFLKD